MCERRESDCMHMHACVWAVCCVSIGRQFIVICADNTISIILFYVFWYRDEFVRHCERLKQYGQSTRLDSTTSTPNAMCVRHITRKK